MRRFPLILLLATVAGSPHPQEAGADPAGSGPSGGMAVAQRGGRVEAAPLGVAAAAPVLALQGELERLITGSGWRGAAWSILVVSLDRGDTIYAHEPERALAPASNLKLYTSAAALYYLGANFRYGTFLMTDGEVRDGVLEGDLVVYGTGDPTIGDRFQGSKRAVLEAFADTLQALGVREVAGSVVGDESYFGGVTTGVGWQDSYRNTWYAAPASSLSYNENLVTLRVRPGERAGWRPEVLLVPGGEGIAIVNQATTVASGRTRISVDRASYDGPIVVKGQIARGHSGVWASVPVPDPGRYTAAVLREVLEERGITVRGGIRSVQREEESPVTGRSVFAPAFDGREPLRVLAIHRSPPLIEILKVVNKKSHNMYAEQVLRTVGRVATGEGTVAGGARAVEHMLATETELGEVRLQMFDGSGLSVLNRSDARTIVALLDFMNRSPIAAEFAETLPEAGRPDGLRRMYRTAAEGNLRAKTGTINNVSALSGYVRAGNGEMLAFSIIANSVPSTWRAKRIEDAIGAKLAAFQRTTGEPTPDVAGADPGAGGGAPAGPAPSGAAVPAAPTRPVATAERGAGTAARTAVREYVIRKGDTFDAIARREGTTVAALRAANPGVNPRRLIPGKKIRLP